MAASRTAPAQSDTSAKVTLESKSLAVGVGVSWGDGVLEYRGKKYPYHGRGSKCLDLGVSKVSACGRRGRRGRAQNQNGGEMGLTATAQGVRLSIAQGGVGVKLKK